MTSWIDPLHPLIGKKVDLLPLSVSHYTELGLLATDKRIWQHYSYNGSDPATFQKIFTRALIEKEQGTEVPFVVFHKQEGKIIGSTRLIDIHPQHKKLEIGSTWLAPSYWGTGINIECKRLLLTYCFEKLHALRVQLKTDELNIRSRKAIEKIGGQFEGIHRKDILRENGTHRSSAYYSLLDDEWQENKSRLENLYAAKSE